ncbi:MAG: DUF4833 domain-containing protein [Prolixibacteraceae bacterium]|nr:DUF4833 domain-containing protein [Prolixibacteraceae bacterium]
MSKQLKIGALVLFFMFDGGLRVWSGSNSSVDKAPLFKIARNRDANEIWYFANYHLDGTLNKDHPVDVFWLKKTAQNKTEPLTWIQNRLAYGVKILKTDRNSVEFQFVSYPKRTFVMKPYNHNFQVFTTSNNREVIVERIFINISGGTFMLPEISQVELYGIDPETGIKTLEVIRP